ncbi:Protein of unknown function [Gryllus bimaculatus]|nr:Protein of unknown function [Gryllus bimaculatus]
MIQKQIASDTCSTTTSHSNVEKTVPVPRGSTKPEKLLRATVLLSFYIFIYGRVRALHPCHLGPVCLGGEAPGREGAVYTRRARRHLPPRLLPRLRCARNSCAAAARLIEARFLRGGRVHPREAAPPPPLPLPASSPPPRSPPPPPPPPPPPDELNICGCPQSSRSSSRGSDEMLALWRRIFRVHGGRGVDLVSVTNASHGGRADARRTRTSRSVRTSRSQSVQLLGPQCVASSREIPARLLLRPPLASDSTYARKLQPPLRAAPVRAASLPPHRSTGRIPALAACRAATTIAKRTARARVATTAAAEEKEGEEEPPPATTTTTARRALSRRKAASAAAGTSGGGAARRPVRLSRLHRAVAAPGSLPAVLTSAAATVRTFACAASHVSPATCPARRSVFTNAGPLGLAASRDAGHRRLLRSAATVSEETCDSYSGESVCGWQSSAGSVQCRGCARVFDDAAVPEGRRVRPEVKSTKLNFYCAGLIKT